MHLIYLCMHNKFLSHINSYINYFIPCLCNRFSLFCPEILNNLNMAAWHNAVCPSCSTKHIVISSYSNMHNQNQHSDRVLETKTFQLHIRGIDNFKTCQGSKCAFKIYARDVSISVDQFQYILGAAFRVDL